MGKSGGKLRHHNGIAKILDATVNGHAKCKANTRDRQDRRKGVRKTDIVALAIKWKSKYLTDMITCVPLTKRANVIFFTK